jgi:uncharacterized protein involved in exopolysaccharide biosynthesis
MEKPVKTELEQLIDFILHCFRHWYYFAISGAVFLVIAVIYLKTATPVFQISASVALRHDESVAGSVGRQSMGMLSSIGIGRGSENVEDETFKLSSQDNFKQVVRSLGLNKIYTLSKCWGLNKTPLYDLSPVLVSSHPALSDTLSNLVEFKLHIDKTGCGKLKVSYGDYRGRFTLDSFPATVSIPCGDFSFSLSPEYDARKKPFDLDILYTSYDYIAQVYRELVLIEFQKKSSDLIYLSMDTPNPKTAKELIVAAVESYNANWAAEKKFVHENTLNYMNRRLAENTVVLSDVDRKIQDFKNRYELTDIAADVKFYYTQSAEIQKELLTLATQIKLTEIVLEFVQDEANRYSLIPFALSNDGQNLNEFIEKYNEAILKRNDLQKSQPQSPLLRKLEEDLTAHRKNLIVTIHTEIDGLRIALADVQQKDSEVNRKIGAVPTVEYEYIQLRREQELQQNIYIFLLEKQEELGIRSASLMPKLKIVEEPYASNELASPRLIRTLVMAFLFGGALIPLALIHGIPYLRTFRKRKE